MGNHLTDFDKGRIYQLYKLGYSVRKIVNETNYKRSTIQDLLYKFKRGDNGERKEGSGRNSILKISDVNYIKKILKKDPFSTCKKIMQNLNDDLKIKVCEETIRIFLKKNHFRCLYPISKPKLNKGHRQARLQIVKEWHFQGETYFNDVIFSDESFFNIYNDSKRQKVWISEGESPPVNETVKFEKKKIFVWGCMSRYGVGRLVFLDGTLDAVYYTQILSNNIRESAEIFGMTSYKF